MPRSSSVRTGLVAAVVLVASFAAPAARGQERGNETWRVLVIHNAEPSRIGVILQEQPARTAMTEGASRPLEWSTEAMDSIRFDSRAFEPEFVALLRRKYAHVRFDVVMPMSVVALDFVERHRNDLWPGVPVVFFSAGVEALKEMRLSADTTGVAIDFDLPGTVDLALRLQPGARRIAVIAGAAEYDRHWLPIAADAIRRHQGLEAIYLSDESLAAMLRDLGSIPKDSIVLYTSFSRDRTGRTFLLPELAEQIALASPAPVYGIAETYIGRGIVGGSIPSFEAQGRRAAEIALRVLNGARADQIPVQPPPPPVPIFDWRQLRKWGLSESALPAGSEIRFRERTFWERYRSYALVTLFVLTVQTTLIAALLVQRRRRHHAELEARRQRAELAHASRLSALGELSASIAHEVNQPLGAILSYAEAAEMLSADKPGLEQVREILAEIRNEDLRASEVIQRIRALARKGIPQLARVDLNQVVEDVLRLLRHDAVRRRVEFETRLSPDLPPVMGDRVQLQQVILNLIVNGMEAMIATEVGRRRVSVLTTREGAEVHISVIDAGSGVDAASLPRLFDSFFTTKKEGMGLGLSIARSIVEAHHGRIWAENNPDAGMTLRVALPVMTPGAV